MTNNSTLRYRHWAALSLLLLLPGTEARADDGTAAEPFIQDATAETIHPFSLDLGVDFVTAYWWNGYLYENKGLIAQPYLEVGVPLRNCVRSPD